MARQIISSKQITIEVCERALLDPLPGTAAPRHAYTPLFKVRASVKSHGSREFGGLDVDGKAVTHTFTIRWTSIPFDARHRVRGVAGDLYQILKVDDIDHQQTELLIRCASMGNEDVEAAR